MIRAREIRIALTGALLFLAVGMVQACASDTISGPAERPVLQANVDSIPDGDAECYWSGGIRICR